MCSAGALEVQGDSSIWCCNAWQNRGLNGIRFKSGGSTGCVGIGCLVCSALTEQLFRAYHAPGAATNISRLLSIVPILWRGIHYTSMLAFLMAFCETESNCVGYLFLL